MSIFGKIWEVIKKVCGSGSSWLVKVNHAVAMLAPLVNGMVTLLAGTENAAIALEVERDLALVSELITKAQQGENVTAKISAALDAVVENLDNLMAAGHIKNPDTQAKVGAMAKTIVEEIAVIIRMLPR